MKHSARRNLINRPHRSAGRGTRRLTRGAARSTGPGTVRLVALSVVFSLITLGVVFVIDGPAGTDHARTPAVAGQEHAHSPTSAQLVLGPLVATSDDVSVWLEARVADERAATVQAIPAGQKVMLNFDLRDPRTGAPLAGLSPRATLTSDVATPINPYGPPDTGDPFDARDTFVLVNGAGDLGVLESDAADAHRHQPGSSLTRLTGSNFSAVVKLPDASVDALADRVGRYIFASVPDRNEVTIVDTLTRRLAHTVAVGKDPTALALEPSGSRVWVGNDGDGTVSTIDTETHFGRVIPVGAGHHEFAFSSDSRLAFVSNSQSQTVSTISTDEGRVIAETPVGGGPASMDFALGRLFVAQRTGGSVAVFDLQADRLILTGIIHAGEGTARVKIHPLARAGIASNRQSNTLTIFDASTLDVVKNVRAGEGPDDIAFLEDYALVRNSLSPDLTFVNLSNPDVADDLVIGSEPYLDMARPGVPTRLFLNAAADEVLVPSPAEGQVYQLHVMMGRPMVMSQLKVDRGSEVVVSPTGEVHESSPGTYTRVVQFALGGGHTLTIDPADGRQPVTFRLDVASATAVRPWAVTSVEPDVPYVAGQAAQIRFQVVERQTNRPTETLQDAAVTVYQFAPGQAPWQRVIAATHAGGGVYQASLLFPTGGTYSATMSALSAGLSPADVPATTLTVAGP